MAQEPVNELTFVARLGAATRLRAERMEQAGEVVLIASGDVEERQVDLEGRVRRCDIRLNSASGRKLASGEVKRPEVPEGRDPRNEALRNDARRKAVARGLPYYFTCNMAVVVLYAVAKRPGEADVEEQVFPLAPITNSKETQAFQAIIEQNWAHFLDDLERRLRSVERVRPSATSGDVLLLRDAIYEVAEEAIGRAISALSADKELTNRLRARALDVFGFPADLRPADPAIFREELLQILRLGVFVIAEQLILHRVLQETGPRSAQAYALDSVVVPSTSSDPSLVRAIIDAAVEQAKLRSRDYETAFEADAIPEMVFIAPSSNADIIDCRTGEVWGELVQAVNHVSWSSISRNVTGFIYEVIVEPRFRHELGQYYTPEDVVDLLTTYAVRNPADKVLDPAAGGGSFLRSAYERKRELGARHEETLEDVWGFEITGFAAELSTITLATSDTHEPAAYPRVILRDAFDLRPGSQTNLLIPGQLERVKIPAEFDAVIGNPPYISFRRQTNQDSILRALATLPQDLVLPRFSGKSDAFVWFTVHATQFLNESGRLAFVVSSALLFADYGVPLILFLARHFRILAVADSAVERWFPDADTNTVLLFLERCSDPTAREQNSIRFVRLLKPLAQLLPPADAIDRRGKLEEFVSELLSADDGSDDPRMRVNILPQGSHGGMEFFGDNDGGAEESE